MKQGFQLLKNAQLRPFKIWAFWWTLSVDKYNIEVSSFMVSVSAGQSFISVLPSGVVEKAPPGRGGWGAWWLFVVSVCVLSPWWCLYRKSNLIGVSLVAWHLLSTLIYLLSCILPGLVCAKKLVIWLNEIIPVCPVCIALSVGSFQRMIACLLNHSCWLSLIYQKGRYEFSIAKVKLRI